MQRLRNVKKRRAAPTPFPLSAGKESKLLAGGETCSNLLHLCTCVYSVCVCVGICVYVPRCPLTDMRYPVIHLGQLSWATASPVQTIAGSSERQAGHQITSLRLAYSLPDRLTPSPLTCVYVCVCVALTLTCTHWYTLYNLFSILSDPSICLPFTQGTVNHVQFEGQ